MKIIDERGRDFDYDAVENLMCDELREELHNSLSPCTEQEFYDAYCIAHEAKYGREFIIN